MRLNFKDEFVCVGNVEVNALSTVTELDSGLVIGRNKYETLEDGSTSATFSHLTITSIEKQLAIVVPCMNEEHFILEGVLKGIPHHCLTILVSNSDSENFNAECKTLIDLCTKTQRRGVVVHQQDPGLASAFADAGMPHVTTSIADIGSKNSTGCMRIHNGKGEAMMIGTALAKLALKTFVGFVDADNFVPGAVYEYCKVFAAGLHHALHDPSSTSSINDQTLAMVRLKWKSKPKIVNSKLVAQESGRCSRIVNEWMNCLLDSITGDESHGELIKTANAGEHAMSIDLALRLQFATGYAVEPFQLINAWERSGIFPPTPPETATQPEDLGETYGNSVRLQNRIKILQIETMNPHIHDFGKGEEHILRMQAQGLSTILHSKLTSQQLKHRLQGFMSDELRAIVSKGRLPDKSRVYPSMAGMKFDVFEDAMKERAETLHYAGTVKEGARQSPL